MSKTIKDILEMGQQRLNEIASKRDELKIRLSDLGKAGAAERDDRLDPLESSSLAEVKSLLNAARETYKQSATQLMEDNDRFLLEIKDELDFRTTNLIKEFQFLLDWYCELSKDKVEQSSAPIEHSYVGAITQCETDVTAGLNQLDLTRRRVEMFIAAEGESTSEQLSALIDSARSRLTQTGNDARIELQREAARLTLATETEHNQQKKALQQVESELEKQLLQVKELFPERARSIRSRIERELKESADGVIAQARNTMSEFGTESVSELEATYNFSAAELSQRISVMRKGTVLALETLTDKLEKLEQQSSTHSARIAADAVNLYKRRIEEAAMKLSSDSEQATIKEMTEEMQRISNELGDHLRKLLASQTERLSTIASTSEQTSTANLESLKFEFSSLLENLRKEFAESEQELSDRFTNLEKRFEQLLIAMNAE